MSTHRWEAAIGVAVVVGWALASHLAALSRLSLVFSLASLAIAACWVVASTPRGQRAWVMLAVGVLGLVLGGLVHAAANPARSLWLAQHAGLLALFGTLFGRTLLPGRTPLITAIATRVHGPLPPAMQSYTRATTVGWTVFFAAMVTASFLLFAWADFAVWSTFANLLTPVCVTAMFLAEYALRHYLHPDFEHATIMQSLAAFSARNRGEKDGKGAA
ncbi:MAG TPA: hypothetical protein VFS42_03845 [Burkholderiaceae bacterium]|nr:hypothetical protein [Burkholderiaceae bacterium]